MTFAWRPLLLTLSRAWLLLLVPLSASAQGSSPPRGMEVLLWIFIAVAALFVLFVSTVLFLLGKRVLFKDREASRLAKLALFAASILASFAAGIVIMLVFDIR